jgi:hypothetical protein
MDWSCDKWSITKSQGGEKFPTKIKRRNANWIFHIFRRNCLLKHVFKGKTEDNIAVTGRLGRRSKQILGCLRILEFEKEAVGRTLWRTRFGRGSGPVLRWKPNERMNEWIGKYKC